jgi:hypothetical protein
VRGFVGVYTRSIDSKGFNLWYLTNFDGSIFDEQQVESCIIEEYSFD